MDKDSIGRSEQVEWLQENTVLSNRQAEVIAFSEAGFTVPKMADELEISESSIESHLSNARKRVETAKKTVNQVNTEKPVNFAQLISDGRLSANEAAIIWAAVESETSILFAETHNGNIQGYSFPSVGTASQSANKALINASIQCVPSSSIAVAGPILEYTPAYTRTIENFSTPINADRIVSIEPRAYNYDWLIDEYKESGVYTTMRAGDTEAVFQNIRHYTSTEHAQKLEGSLVVNIRRTEPDDVGGHILSNISAVTGINDDGGLVYEHMTMYKRRSDDDDVRPLPRPRLEKVLEESGVPTEDFQNRVEYLDVLSNERVNYNEFVTAMRFWHSAESPEDAVKKINSSIDVVLGRE